jgi:hypothetical protein
LAHLTIISQALLNGTRTIFTFQILEVVNNLPNLPITRLKPLEIIRHTWIDLTAAGGDAAFGIAFDYQGLLQLINRTHRLLMSGGIFLGHE